MQKRAALDFLTNISLDKKGQQSNTSSSSLTSSLSSSQSSNVSTNDFKEQLSSTLLERRKHIATKQGKSKSSSPNSPPLKPKDGHEHKQHHKHHHHSHALPDKGQKQHEQGKKNNPSNRTDKVEESPSKGKEPDNEKGSPRKEKDSSSSSSEYSESSSDSGSNTNSSGHSEKKKARKHKHKDHKKGLRGSRARAAVDFLRGISLTDSQRYKGSMSSLASSTDSLAPPRDLSQSKDLTIPQLARERDKQREQDFERERERERERQREKDHKERKRSKKDTKRKRRRKEPKPKDDKRKSSKENTSNSESEASDTSSDSNSSAGSSDDSSDGSSETSSDNDSDSSGSSGSSTSVKSSSSSSSSSSKSLASSKASVRTPTARSPPARSPTEPSPRLPDVTLTGSQNLRRIKAEEYTSQPKHGRIYFTSNKGTFGLFSLIKFDAKSAGKKERVAKQEAANILAASGQTKKAVSYGHLVMTSDWVVPSPSAITSSSESTGLFYDPLMLDDPSLTTGKHRTIMNLAGFRASIIPFVKPRVIKEELNQLFREKHPGINPGVDLHKLRKLKKRFVEVAVTENLDVSTVALAYVYFEKLVMKNVVTKSTIRPHGAACLLLAMKFNEAKSERVKSMVETMEKQLKVPAKDIMHWEFPIFACLSFGLYIKPEEATPHYSRIMTEHEELFPPVIGVVISP